ncbi:MAG: TM0996/MTH895 family glutaredoxin-like protein [Gemmatimonadota bacterium]|nr:MAG: TM0996/MTH895 family glutaredoxin-like protein [Gemmatimonadota bacterium]
MVEERCSGIRKGVEVKIEVFGPGCAKCTATAKYAHEAVAELGLDAEVVKVEKLDEIMKRGVLMTPAVFIDGKKYSEGKMVKKDQIKEWIRSGM